MRNMLSYFVFRFITHMEYLFIFLSLQLSIYVSIYNMCVCMCSEKCLLPSGTGRGCLNCVHTALWWGLQHHVELLQDIKKTLDTIDSLPIGTRYICMIGNQWHQPWFFSESKERAEGVNSSPSSGTFLTMCTAQSAAWKHNQNIFNVLWKWSTVCVCVSEWVCAGACIKNGCVCYIYIYIRK